MSQNLVLSRCPFLAARKVSFLQRPVYARADVQPTLRRDGAKQRVQRRLLARSLGVLGQGIGYGRVGYLTACARAPQAAALADFMLPMLQYDPDRRATAAEMLRHSWLARASGPALPCARDADALHAAVGPAERKVQGASAEGPAEHGGGGGGGGGRHGAERRRAYSGRSRSRSASPSHPRSRCGAFAVWLRGHVSRAQLHVVVVWWSDCLCGFCQARDRHSFSRPATCRDDGGRLRQG